MDGSIQHYIDKRETWGDVYCNGCWTFLSGIRPGLHGRAVRPQRLADAVEVSDDDEAQPEGAMALSALPASAECQVAVAEDEEDSWGDWATERPELSRGPRP